MEHELCTVPMFQAWLITFVSCCVLDDEDIKMMKISCLVVVFIILVTSGNVFAVQVSMIICLRGLLRGIGELWQRY